MENQGVLWSLLFDQISDGICVTAPDGPILYMNPAARKLLGVPKDWEFDRSLCELLCANMHRDGGGDCAGDCPLRPADAQRDSVTLKGQYESLGMPRSRGLRVRCLKMPSVLMDAKGKEGHLTIIEDISAELELAKEKQDWRHMMAHDLRTPMTTIFGTLRLLQDVPDGEALGIPERRQLSASLRACQRMTELVDLYLDLAKLEAGAMPLKPERIELGRIVRESVELARPFAESRRIRLSLSGEAKLGATADKELTRRIVDNILNNALKFTPEGGSVTVRLIPGRGGTAAVRIQDTGPGISHEDLPHIFDRFYQAKVKRDPGLVRSTGLGLAFCQRASKAMGGRIEVLSEPGKGSEFIIALPAGAPAPVPASAS